MSSPTTEVPKPETRPKLPEGWRWVRLGDVTKVVGGSTPKTGIKEYWNGDIVWITPADLGKLSTREIYSSGRKITQLGYESSGAELVPVKTVVMSSRAPIGHLGIAAVPLCTNQGCKSFIPSESIDSVYLYFVLKQAVPELQLLGRGATFLEISKTQLENYFIPLPPLETQRRIAAILTEQMEAVEKARKAAEEGLEAARKLTAGHLRAVFESEEARGWPGRLAREIGAVSGGIQKTPQRKPSAFHKPFLTVRNVQNGWIDLSNVERFEVTPEELKRYRLVRGDLLIVEGNGSREHIGRCAIFHGEIEDCVHQNHLIRLRCHETASPTYLFWYLASPDGRKQLLEKAKTTTGLYTLSVSKIEALEVPLPPLETQHRIVAELNAKLEATQALIRSLEAQLEAIRALPAAILRRAFSGEL